ncbi:hypothetical protein JXA31_03200 [Candidatus Bathyarchaeota archaeon]|nr:hypothetical protein [Candidatus Bathyarchaeota archaeon]
MKSSAPQTEPKKRSRRFYVILAAAVLLIAIIISAVFLSFFMMGQTSYGPGPVDIEVTSEKQFYLQGEEVIFIIYVNNPQEWPVPYPYSVLYIVEKDCVYVASLGGGQIDYVAPSPKFPSHSKTLYGDFLMPWNQTTNLNGTRVQVQPGNYTLTVSLSGYGYDASGNCSFEIRPNS